MGDIPLAILGQDWSYWASDNFQVHTITFTTLSLVPLSQRVQYH